MTDRMIARREFLRESSASRLRIIGECLAAIGGLLLDGFDEAVKEKIDEATWLIEWAVPDEVHDIQVELVELQQALHEWRGELPAIAAVAAAREGIRDQACVWSEWLMWMSALLEATA